ncbi:MAG: DUF1611 domain-containing protein [Spirochaetia bacterium]|nr:DUF1611 domain-containing protein [Spirochaetia bacterium]
MYTGQTGWLQGMEYGFILDATPNDFVSGELEYQVPSCDREKRPGGHIDGRSGLHFETDSGPLRVRVVTLGSSGGVISQHDPKRSYFEPVKKKSTGQFPQIESEIELIRMYGSEVLAITLNESHFSNPHEWPQWKRHLQKELGIPASLLFLKEWMSLLN